MVLSSKTNTSPDIWGNYFWKVFHLSAFGYPQNPNVEDLGVYENFYINFMKILPCSTCSTSAEKLIKYSNWEKILKSRESLIKWTYFFHDKVNKKLKKPSPPYEYFTTTYKNENIKECSKKIEYILIYTLLILIILTFIAHYFLEIPLVPSIIVSSFF